MDALERSGLIISCALNNAANYQTGANRETFASLEKQFSCLSASARLKPGRGPQARESSTELATGLRCPTDGTEGTGGPSAGCATSPYSSDGTWFPAALTRGIKAGNMLNATCRHNTASGLKITSGDFRWPPVSPVRRLPLQKLFS